MVVQHVVIQHVVIQHVVIQHVVIQHVVIQHVVIQHMVIQHVVIQHVVIQHVVIQHVVIQHVVIHTACCYTACGDTACGDTACCYTACGDTACCYNTSHIALIVDVRLTFTRWFRLGPISSHGTEPDLVRQPRQLVARVTLVPGSHTQCGVHRHQDDSIGGVREGTAVNSCVERPGGYLYDCSDRRVKLCSTSTRQLL